MTRLLYACLLRLHPKDFRRRFAEEMLWIFDQESGVARRSALLADALVSVCRQRLWRREHRESASFFYEPPMPSADGVPVFYVSRPDMPRVGALFNGSLLSIVAFGAVALVIAHGGGASGFIHLPRVIVSSSNASPPRKQTSTGVRRPRHTDTTQPIGTAEQQAWLSVEQRWVERTPPVEHENSLTGDAGGSAPSTLGATANLDGTTTVYRVIPTDAASKLVDDVAILFSELDKNEDGVITKVEWERENRTALRSLLDCADFDKDGGVLLRELRDAVTLGEGGCADRAEE